MVDFGIGEIALATTIMSGITSAAGAVYTGAAKSAAYSYQAGIAEMNARVAKQNAAYEAALGEVQAQREGMKSRDVISKTRAMQGASGLDVNSGTAAAVRSSELSLGQFDQATIRSNAARRAYSWEVTAAGETATANLDRMAASTSKTGSYIDAFSSILGAGSSFSSKWMMGRSMGLWGGSDS